jgi:hypothetical protein
MLKKTTTPPSNSVPTIADVRGHSVTSRSITLSTRCTNKGCMPGSKVLLWASRAVFRNRAGARARVPTGARRRQHASDRPWHRPFGRWSESRPGSRSVEVDWGETPRNYWTRRSASKTSVTCRQPVRLRTRGGTLSFQPSGVDDAANMSHTACPGHPHSYGQSVRRAATTSTPVAISTTRTTRL